MIALPQKIFNIQIAPVPMRACAGRVARETGSGYDGASIPGCMQSGVPAGHGAFGALRMMERYWKDAAPWGPVPPCPGERTWDELMGRALEAARQAMDAEEVPVGALVIAGDGRLLSLAHNETVRSCDPTAHAEVLALRRAAQAFGSHRLCGAVLVVTLEPCLMCAGAMLEARLAGVVYGAADMRAGAVFSRMEGLQYAGTGGIPWHYGGVRSKECADLLRDFFALRRV